MDHIVEKKELAEGGYQKVSTGNTSEPAAYEFPGGVKPPLVRRPSTGKFVSPDASMKQILDGDVEIPHESTKSLIVESNSDPNDPGNAWEYPGWGSVYEKTIVESELPPPVHRHRLDLLRSTAIAGNDLLASVLYTTGIVCSACGQLAPFAMLLCCFALYPFRKIFQECGTALPLNGGVYVAMLNSASKIVATFAASCSLISYSATAVVSAASCTTYASSELGAFPELPVTIGVMGIFGVLVFFGVKDSANMATFIFAVHVLTLIILIIASLVEMIRNDGEVWKNNWHYPLPISKEGKGMDLYLGYSVALLGLTGFETSANYIEEIGPFEASPKTAGKQRQISIFEQTIDKMWWLVILINPAIAVSTLGVVEMDEILNNQANILAILGKRSGGEWLRIWVAIDAVMVLAGGVLTAFVGVVGLIKQLSADRCLPKFLLQENSLTKTNHWIIFGFFLLCSILYLMTNGDIIVVSGVFAVAFLMVLILFATANMFLKYHRPRLPRGISISWPGVLIGWSVMVIGLIGNIIFNQDIIVYFIIYLAFYFSVIVITFEMVPILKMLLYIVRQTEFTDKLFAASICVLLKSLKQHTVVYFAKTSELSQLNKAILYARDNELCDRLVIVHVACYGPCQRCLEDTPLSPDLESMEQVEHQHVHKSSATPANHSEQDTSSSSHHQIELTYLKTNEHYHHEEGHGQHTPNSTTGSSTADPHHHHHHQQQHYCPHSLQTIEQLKVNLQLLDHVYPKMKIDLLLVNYKEFSPRLVAKLSEDLDIKPSFMFIRCPGENFKFNIGEFNGVRSIMQ